MSTDRCQSPEHVLQKLCKDENRMSMMWCGMEYFSRTTPKSPAIPPHFQSEWHLSVRWPHWTHIMRNRAYSKHDIMWKFRMTKCAVWLCVCGLLYASTIENSGRYWAKWTPSINNTLAYQLLNVISRTTQHVHILDHTEIPTDGYRCGRILLLIRDFIALCEHI